MTSLQIAFNPAIMSKHPTTPCHQEYEGEQHQGQRRPGHRLMVGEIDGGRGWENERAKRG
jgi:hypothetical protein